MAPIKIETAYMSGDMITVRDLTERIGKTAGEIIKQLDRSSGHRLDLPGQLSKLLKSFMADTHHGFASACPECAGRLVFKEGCESCLDCGYSKCS